jgi:hypothetical protein
MAENQREVNDAQEVDLTVLTGQITGFFNRIIVSMVRMFLFVKKTFGLDGCLIKQRMVFGFSIKKTRV